MTNPAIVNKLTQIAASEKERKNKYEYEQSQLSPDEKAALNAALKAKKVHDAERVQRIRRQLHQEKEDRRLQREKEAREQQESRAREQQTDFNMMQTAYFRERDARRRVESGLPPLPLNNTYEGGSRRKRTHKRTLRKHKRRTHKRAHRRTHKR